MEEVVMNDLMHDGMRRLKVIGDSFERLRLFYLAVPVIARDKMKMSDSHDQALGIYSMELTWPVYGPYDIAIASPKKFRRVMMVHYSYAERVSDCIKLAAEAFMQGTHLFPKYAWVREIPAGAKDCMEVHHMTLIESEIAPSNCVMVGEVWHERDEAMAMQEWPHPRVHSLE